MEQKRKQIIECVPNFSEGRDAEIIEAIAAAIRETDGCTLLDIDPGLSTNRTVYTFVGDPDSIMAGALAAARIAWDRIDMRHHRGEHPRFGALDVCPFIPVAGISMDECAQLAKRFAQAMAEELRVPVYLYEAAAEHPHRSKLPDIRSGEYEGLAERLKDRQWQPDYGPAEFIPGWGATAVGARNFLIAYNVNILGTPNQAHRIALNLREAGRGDREPGRLKEVKAMGWFVGEYNLAQVTANLTNHEVTPLHVFYEEVAKEAAALNIGVAGSEIVGIVPLKAVLAAADHFIEKEQIFLYEEDQKVRLAIERLGLNSVADFHPKDKIIDYIVAEPPDAPLASMSVRGFIEEIGARSSAPGGGSASAAIAAIGAALGAMVAKLTYGVRKFDGVSPHMQRIIPPLHELTQNLLPMIDADTSAFNEFMEGLRMPGTTAAEREARRARMQAGLKTATLVPLTTMRLADSGWELLVELASYGNPASKSDVQVGARALETGIWGAYQNVLINLRDIEDKDFNKEILEEAETLVKRAAESCAEVLARLDRMSDESSPD